MINKKQKVMFGMYPQMADKGDSEISWIVLEVLQDKALLLSEQCLDILPYNEKRIVCTWESCSLRYTLNVILYNSIFNESERALVLESLIPNSDNTVFPAKGGEPSAGGKDTTDRLFLLSPSEIEEFFPNNKDAVAFPSDYVKREHANSQPEKISYWLRGPGMRGNLAVYVDTNGLVNHTGYHVECADFGVRPAMWVNISDPLFDEYVTVRDEESVFPGKTEPEREQSNEKNGYTTSLIAGVTGAIIALVSAILTIIGLINTFKLLFILSVIGVMSSIVGIVTALNGGSGRRIVIILSIIALIVNIVIFALSGYILLHNIWSIP